MSGSFQVYCTLWEWEKNILFESDDNKYIVIPLSHSMASHM